MNPPRLERQQANQPDCREQQHRGLGTSPGRVEVLLGTAQSARQHCGTKHQQDVPNDRPRDGSLDDVVKTGAQRGERDYELSGVTERGIEKSSHSFSHSFRELFGGAAHPPC